MRQYGIDLWVVPMREYNEDPVFKALVGPTTFAARRRTIYVFFDKGGGRRRGAARAGRRHAGRVYDARRSRRQGIDVGQRRRGASCGATSSGSC